MSQSLISESWAEAMMFPLSLFHWTRDAPAEYDRPATSHHTLSSIYTQCSQSSLTLAHYTHTHNYVAK